MAKLKVLEVIRQGQIGGGESHLLDLIYFMDKEKRMDSIIFQKLVRPPAGGKSLSFVHPVKVRLHPDQVFDRRFNSAHRLFFTQIIPQEISVDTVPAPDQDRYPGNLYREFLQPFLLYKLPDLRKSSDSNGSDYMGIPRINQVENPVEEPLFSCSLHIVVQSDFALETT